MMHILIPILKKRQDEIRLHALLGPLVSIQNSEVKKFELC